MNIVKTAAVLIAIILIAQTADAEVYKCTVNGSTKYQSSPCQEAEKPALKIKQSDPEKNAGPTWQERHTEYLKQKKLEAEIAREQALANSLNSSAEASRTLSETSERREDAYERDAEASRRESEAREHYWKKMSGLAR